MTKIFWCRISWLPFQLTSSRRGWRAAVVAEYLARKYFNSHAHEEDDQQETPEPPKQDISTHILTKRMTAATNSHRSAPIKISTHILTKRMTSSNYSICFTWLISTHILTKRMTIWTFQSPLEIVFQLTSSRRGWQEMYIKLTGHWVFQLTSSRRGWRHYNLRIMFFQVFQLTSSRRGWPYMDATAWKAYAFQLTSSRRGWLVVMLLALASQYFNSHPHEEDDGI